MHFPSLCTVQGWRGLPLKQAFVFLKLLPLCSKFDQLWAEGLSSMANHHIPARDMDTHFISLQGPESDGQKLSSALPHLIFLTWLVRRIWLRMFSEEKLPGKLLWVNLTGKCAKTVQGVFDL